MVKNQLRLSPHSVRKRKSHTLPGLDDFQVQAAVDSNQEEHAKRISYFQLYRYSTGGERLLIILAVILATIAAVFIPYSVVIYGEFSSLLIDRTGGVGTSSPTFILALFGGGKVLTNATKEENNAAIVDDSIAYGLGSLAGAILLLVFIAMAVDIVNRIALKQIGRIRKVFLRAVLRQEMSWYDTNSSTNFASKVAEDLDKMKEGIGEKVTIFTFLIMTFVLAIVASFFYGWKLTLVVLTCCPFIIVSTAMVAKIQSSLTEKELKSYSGAGSVAEEVFSGIRTVFAFSGERKETERFSKLLGPAEETGRKKGLYSGIGSAVMWFIIFACNGLAMWYGITLILDDRGEEVRTYTPAVLVIVLFGIIMGAQNVGFSSPHVEAFAGARGAAQSVFAVIDRQSKIDPLDEHGKKPEDITGNIQFKDITFRYPARPDIEILRGLSLDIEAGKTVAFVGASGCGKSTLLQLMQRFYDPLDGSVQLDGQDLRTLNVNWLRAQIGVVGQEPVLFATTIRENIRYGYTQATQEDIERAAKTANCHDFIVRLPKGYDTLVGERGAQMSGGQKQRIAIARALVRNPRILLLDEATSALDPTSEKRVQDALEVASQGRTTLVVSHRLSTVTNADKIVFVKDGVVVEQGTHEELMAKGGFYNQLVNITKRKEATEDVEDPETIRPSLDSRTPKPYESSSEDDDADVYHQKIDTAEGSRHRYKQKKEKYNITFRQLLRLNAPEWPYLLCGCIAAVALGATFPIWAVFFGNFFGIMSDEDADYVRSSANKLALVFVGIGLLAGLGVLAQTYMFNTAGVKMTSRLRKTAFKTIISQEVAYFDDPKNSVGALCARLATDCSSVQGATGARIGIMVQAAATVIVGMIIAFIFSWKMTLLTLVTIPVVCFTIFLESRFVESSARAEREAIEHASQVAVEAIANIRTVASLGQESDVIKRYTDRIDQMEEACRRKVRYRGLVFGLGQASPFLAYGLSLYYGGTLVAKNEMPYEDIIKVSEALIFGSWMLGQALAYAPNVNEGIMSAGRLMKLFERKSTVHNPADKPYNTAESEGDITYEHVEFEYPTRKGTTILRNLNLTIKKGTTVALVGPSGSGKSTCVQLLLRFYDPTGGSVNLSGVPTTDFSFDTLRSKMGLVSQEPVLFDRTIAENIAYGNNFRDDIPMSEIMEAARKANIHNFIITLPQGYDTSLGSKGAQLSGGQKQRVAIARALVRNPKILILDEATSALDLESEKVVQEALDVARSGRTCLTIAHRLTTVRDADLICVLRKGIVVEQGTHDELISMNGIYAELYQLQQVAD
ncbi:multidrug resistance protein homolog 49 isoform X2 [Scaptodrosophila lebanonensis]|uniref:ABC-type xenobiotic transporter n=1 Tax=Drosophila lebanonensis TaxID=7225 RepID=A0A6J2UMD1_DROLE|nr:multidrug resistance protein homolog 49 isoform X2 [Scaptodrosophila lebanonensis]